MTKVAALVSSRLQNRSETLTRNWAPHLKQSTLEQQVRVGNYRTELKVNTIILQKKGFWWPSVEISQLIILYLRITRMFPHLCNSASSGILDHCSPNFGPRDNYQPLTFLTIYVACLYTGEWVELIQNGGKKSLLIRWHIGHCYLYASQGPLSVSLALWKPQLWRVSSSTRNHRIIEWFGLEGTFKGHLVQPPPMSRDIFN